MLQAFLIRLALVLLLFSCLFKAEAAVILQYHHVANDTPFSTSVTPNQFAMHLAMIKEQEFKVIALSELITAIKNKQTIADKTIALTFDDGYQNIAENAHPLLKKYGFPYTIFVNPELIDKKQGGLLTWQQLKILSEDGVTIANHSSRHDYLVRVSKELTAKDKEGKKDNWVQQIRSDILQAEQRIYQEIGQSHRMLAYPYGEFSLALQKLLADLDFIGFGQHSGAVGISNDLTRIPRFPASGSYAGIEQLQQKLYSLSFDLNFAALPDMLVTQNPPQMLLAFNTKQTDFTLSQIQCFYQGKPTLKLTVYNDTLSISNSESLVEGRSRYNCTAPSNRAIGRYYWFSQPWLVMP